MSSAQALFGGEVGPSDKGHAGAGQVSSDTYCYDYSKVPALLTPGNIPARIFSVRSLVSTAMGRLPCQLRCRVAP